MTAFAMLLPGVSSQRGWRVAKLDTALISVVAAIASIGLVMVASASMPVAERLQLDTLHYLIRQSIYIVMGIALGLIVLRVPLQWWQNSGFACLLAALGLLALVLVPGVGYEVNGSTRWINLGLFRLQVSEVAKFLMIVYMASYLVRHREEIQNTTAAFLKPMLVVAIAAFLLLMEPDFGTTVVMTATVLVMMYMGGVSVWKFITLLSVSGVSLYALAVTSTYRMKRLTGFMDPWDDPYDSGFQLTQSLIAIGRGEWLGVGLGASIQKLFYLPEAHTDFVFAVMAEELGLVAVAFVLGLYAFVVWRCYRIAFRAFAANSIFAGYVAYGVGTWIALQTLINVGVNTGVLPTKGLTLPFMSYGGSSLLALSAAMALVLRVDYETAGTRKGISAVATKRRNSGGRR
ncbi:MAG: putative lipid II flippase FtsW [Gammaproteobacteria bacterium]